MISYIPICFILFHVILPFAELYLYLFFRSRLRLAIVRYLQYQSESFVNNKYKKITVPSWRQIFVELIGPFSEALYIEALFPFCSTNY